MGNDKVGIGYFRQMRRLIVLFACQRSAWHPRIVDELGMRYRIFLLSIPRSCPQEVEGKNLFRLLTEALKDTLDALLGAERSQPPPITLVAHGLGCYLALLFENTYPDAVAKLVLLDNGIRKTYLLSELFYTFSYEFLFSFVYFLHLHVSVWLATFLLRLVLFATEAYRAYYKLDRGDLHQVFNMHSKMCYVYSYLLVGRLTGAYIQPKFPRCPVLFLYGAKKRAMLHDDEFIWNIESQARSQSQGQDPSATPLRHRTSSTVSTAASCADDSSAVDDQENGSSPRPTQIYLRQRLYSYSQDDDTIKSLDRVSSPPFSVSSTDGGRILEPVGRARGKSRYCIVQNAGHYFTRTQPLVVLQEMATFLANEED